jgi:hypothetical protein
MVIAELRLHQRHRYRDLKSLALVPRQFRLVSQHMLYCNVVINAAQYDEYHDWANEYESGGGNPLEPFVRTLTKRPPLACAIQSLKLDVSKRTIGNRSKCWLWLHKLKKGHNWSGTTAICKRFIKQTARSTIPAFRDPDRIFCIEKGEPLAIVGLILPCTSHLRELTLNQWSSFRTYRGDIPETPYHIIMYDLLGLMWENEAFEMGWITSLANIQVLKTNCLLSPQILQFPKVRDLCFALQDGQSLCLPEEVCLPDHEDVR